MNECPTAVEIDNKIKSLDIVQDKVKINTLNEMREFVIEIPVMYKNIMQGNIVNVTMLGYYESGELDDQISQLGVLQNKVNELTVVFYSL